METLNEIEAREHAVKERAFQYQNLVSELERCRNLVANFTPQLDALTPLMRQLEEIQSLALLLPRDLTGTQGVICRDQIQMTIVAAMKNLGHKRERLMRQVEPAAAKIPALEKQIDAFDK
jgi:hypothetical protein